MTTKMISIQYKIDLLQISGRNQKMQEGLTFSQVKKNISKFHLLPMSEIVIDKVNRNNNLETNLNDNDTIQDNDTIFITLKSIKAEILPIQLVMDNKDISDSFSIYKGDLVKNVRVKIWQSHRSDGQQNQMNTTFEHPQQVELNFMRDGEEVFIPEKYEKTLLEFIEENKIEKQASNDSYVMTVGQLMPGQVIVIFQDLFFQTKNSCVRIPETIKSENDILAIVMQFDKRFENGQNKQYLALKAKNAQNNEHFLIKLYKESKLLININSGGGNKEIQQIQKYIGTNQKLKKNDIITFQLSGTEVDAQ